MYVFIYFFIVQRARPQKATMRAVRIEFLVTKDPTADNREVPSTPLGLVRIAIRKLAVEHQPPSEDRATPTASCDRVK